jgi:hypothetical protein
MAECAVGMSLPPALSLSHDLISWYEYSTDTILAVIIGLTPLFAVLIRASRTAGKKTPRGYVNRDEQELRLTTIGGSGSSGNRRKQKSAENWIEMNDSQEALAGKHEAVSVTTSAH